MLAQTVETTTADELLGIVRQASAEAGATLLTNADPDVGAEVLGRLAIDKAELVIEQMESEPAARLMERVSTDKGVELIGVIPGAQSADIWSLMEKVKAGELMDEAPLDWAVQVVGLVSEERLIPRLPEVSPDRLWDMPLETLLDRLPNVPVMQLDRWNRPDVLDDLPAPTGTEVSDTLTTCNVPETRVSEWATVVSSPAPFDRIWARFTRALKDVKVTVENLPEQPLGTPQFPPDRKVNAFVNVGFENAQPEDVAVAAGMLFVEKSWLEANEVHKWSIEFNRFDEGANRWTPFQSKRVREDSERIFFAVVVPGFSTLAITGGSGPAEQIFDVKDLKITPATPFAGQEFTIGATVTNLGTETAVYPANLWLNDNIEGVVTVNVSPGETVPFSVQRHEARGGLFGASGAHRRRIPSAGRAGRAGGGGRGGADVGWGCGGVGAGAGRWGVGAEA